MSECSKCGTAVHVRDGDDFEDGVDMCWDCERKVQADRIAALEAENQQLRENAVEQFKREAKILTMEYSAMGKAEIRMASPAVAIIAHMLLGDFERAKAANFIEQEIALQPVGGPSFLITMVKQPEGKSPAVMLAEAKKRIESLERSLNRAKRKLK